MIGLKHRNPEEVEFHQAYLPFRSSMDGFLSNPKTSKGLIAFVLDEYL
jgi:hypothetical protein